VIVSAISSAWCISATAVRSSDCLSILHHPLDNDRVGDTLPVQPESPARSLPMLCATVASIGTVKAVPTSMSR
jgi:hypothetical protein